MLSHQLIRMIEDHWEQITERVLTKIRQDPELVHLGKLGDAELHQWGRDVLKNLDHWLSASRELGRRYEGLGRLRFEESIPLYEAVHGIHLLKEEMIDFVRSRGFGRNPVELYAEEELEHRVGHFFDWLVEHFVHGYEEALREAAHFAA